MRAWYGVDLDGTLAYYNGWVDITHIGPPILLMLKRVEKWLLEGKDVRIVTARVSNADPSRDIEEARRVIERWCLAYIGRVLPVTNSKDFGMVELWDDRVIQVKSNTGIRIDGKE